MKRKAVALPLSLVVALFGFAPSSEGQASAGFDPQTSRQTSEAADGREEQLQDIELDRSGFVAKLLLNWSDRFADGGAEMERYLLQAPVERLHAASMARDFETFRAAATGRAPVTSVLGDVGSDLVFFPVPPCRVFNTQTAVAGILVAGVVRSFRVNGDMTSQGGSAGGCGIPTDPSAVVFNLAAVTPAGAGNIRAWAFSGPVPTAAAINFNPGNTNPALSNMITVPTCNLCGDDISLRADVSNVHAVGDIVGYYDVPSTAYQVVSQAFPIDLCGVNCGILRTVDCPVGTRVMGGGVQNDNFQLVVVESRPTSTGWSGWIKNPSASTQASNMIVHAICAASP